jgi:hypothetical protein
MKQERPPSSLEILSNRFFARLPAPLRDKTNTLTQAQKINIMLILAGSIGFLLLWLVFATLFSRDTAYLDERAFSKQTTSVPNTPTAITTEETLFPAHTEQAKIVETEHTDSDIIKPVIPLTPSQEEEIKRLRDNVKNEYQTSLSFPLTENRMVVFAQAATRIDLINKHWDTLIAGANTEKLANEYLSSAQIEIHKSLDTTKNINRNEYNEIYDLSSRDNKFNAIANAYKDLVAQGIWGPMTPVTPPASDNARDERNHLRFPVAPEQEAPQQSNVNPTATPDGSDTLPTQTD